MICLHHGGAILALLSAYAEESPTYEVWWYELHTPGGLRRSTPPKPNAEPVPFSWADSALATMS